METKPISLVELTFAPRFDDLDNNDNLSLKSLLKLMLETAGIASSKVGYGKFDIPKTNVAWLLLNWKVKVLKNIEYNEKITIKTWPRKTKRFYSYRDFEVFNKSGEKVAIASTKWVLVNPKDHSIQKITEEIEKNYKITEKSVFKEGITDKLKEPTSSKKIKEYTVQRRDIDSYNHVNNLCYLDFALETLPEEIYNSTNFTNLEIMYKKESKLGECLSFFYSFEQGKHIITVKSADETTLHSIIILN